MIIHYLKKIFPRASRPLSPAERTEYNAAEIEFTAEGAPLPVNPAEPDPVEPEIEPPVKIS